MRQQGFPHRGNLLPALLDDLTHRESLEQFARDWPGHVAIRPHALTLTGAEHPATGVVVMRFAIGGVE